MRTCKWCGKSGWLLTTSKEGLCQKCEPEVRARVALASRALKESLVMMRRAKDVDEQLMKGQHAIRQLQEIIPYYEKGLVTLKPSPQEMVARVHHDERLIVRRHIEAQYRAAISKVRQVRDSALRVSYLDQILGEIAKYQDQLGQALTQKLQKKVETAKASLLVEKAEKDVVKGRRFAIDQYIEALDMLRVDESGNQHNERQIEEIKKRIRDLGGEVPLRWESSGKENGMSGDSLPQS